MHRSWAIGSPVYHRYGIVVSWQSWEEGQVLAFLLGRNYDMIASMTQEGEALGWIGCEDTLNAYELEKEKDLSSTKKQSSVLASLPNHEHHIYYISRIAEPRQSFASFTS